MCPVQNSIQKFDVKNCLVLKQLTGISIFDSSSIIKTYKEILIFHHIVSLFCSLLIFPLCMTRCGSTDGSLLNEHTRINKTNMSAAREWTDYLMAIFYSRLLIPVGNIKVILLTLLHKEALHSRMWGKLSFHLANSSCVDNQSELF